MYTASSHRVSSGNVIRIGGFFLLLTGWGVVLCALWMLYGTALGAFVVTGLAVELCGMFLVGRTFLPKPSSSRERF